MNFKYKYKETYRIQIEKVIKEENIQTVNQLLDLLYGNYNSDFESDYKVLFERDPYIESTKLQRFNLFWVWPLWLITIPFQYIIRGEYGVKKETKLGQILTKLIGHY